MSFPLTKVGAASRPRGSAGKAPKLRFDKCLPLGLGSDCHPPHRQGELLLVNAESYLLLVGFETLILHHSMFLLSMCYFISQEINFMLGLLRIGPVFHTFFIVLLFVPRRRRRSVPGPTLREEAPKLRFDECPSIRVQVRATTPTSTGGQMCGLGASEAVSLTFI